MRILLAFLRRDAVIELSYRMDLVLDAIGALSVLFTLHFVGLTVGESAALAPYGGEWFPFAVLGLAVALPMNTALECMATQVRQAQLQGTLEAVLASPIGPRRAVLYASAWQMLGALVRMALFLGLAVAAFGVPLRAEGVPVAALAFGLALVVMGALGLLSAAFILLVKRGDPVGAALQHASLLLGGVLFPVDVMPAWLRAAAEVLPLTHALAVMRASLLVGEGPIGRPLATLFVLAVVLVPLSIAVYDRALARALREGSLAHY